MAEATATAVPASAPPWRFDGYDRVPRPMRLAPAPVTLDILFLYSRSPLPMTRGDELTVAHLLEFLAARGHRVDFISIKGKGEALRPEHQRWLEARCRRVQLVEQDRRAAFWQGIKGFLRGWPFQIGYLHVPEQLRAARRAAVEHDYDLAYAYYIRSAEALRAVQTQVPTRFLALQLSQTLNTERLARTAARWWERLFYRVESRRMAAYEARIWQIADRTVLIGAKDVEAIEVACRQQGQPLIDNVVLGPHGVDTERFQPRPGAEEADTVVMSGVMRYAPNVEAALWFLTQVWARIREARPAARLFLVGRDPTTALLAHNGRDGVTITGTVDEPADWIARGAVCVAPIRAAAGLQNKLLEALAMGKAVVATPEANEGIQAPAGEALLLAREPASFAAAVLELLKDAARRQALSRAGRAFVETKWTWEAPFLTLEAAFLEAAHGTIKGHQAERRSSMISA
jgi:glycosyltransferase involved in cell wall biosynthesis